MATNKQKKALEILVESGGKIPVSKAMEKAGYSSATAKTPQKLTESNAYQQLFPVDKTKQVVNNLHKLAISAEDQRVQHEATKTWLDRAIPKTDAPTAVQFNNIQINQREKYDL